MPKKKGRPKKYNNLIVQSFGAEKSTIDKIVRMNRIDCAIADSAGESRPNISDTINRIIMYYFNTTEAKHE